MHSIGKKLLAEFIGTFALLFIGAGAACADSALRAASSGGGGLGMTGIALAHGLVIGAMVIAAGNVSGAHFNPAVTIGCWVTRRIGTLDALLYWLAQLAGATAGAYLLRLALPEEVWSGALLGLPQLASGISRASGMMMEAAATFLLVWVVFATAVDERAPRWGFSGLAIGAAMAMGVLVIGGFTGGAVNPARAFGPALAGGAPAYWTQQAVHWIGPLFGGALAAALYDAVFLKKDRAAE